MAKSQAQRADVIPLLAEAFRAHGFEGASLADISAATGLGKGSLYHFFPGGKDEMAQAVLAHIDGWFTAHVFAPLRQTPDPQDGIAQMLSAVDAYFRSGRRLCLAGVFAIGATPDPLAKAVRGYFRAWVHALADALTRAGHKPEVARGDAEAAVAAIQGALVLARGLDDPAVFSRTLARWRDAFAGPAG